MSWIGHHRVHFLTPLTIIKMCWRCLCSGRTVPLSKQDLGGKLIEPWVEINLSKVETLTLQICVLKSQLKKLQTNIKHVTELCKFFSYSVFLSFDLFSTAYPTFTNAETSLHPHILHLIRGFCPGPSLEPAPSGSYLSMQKS